MIDDIESGNAVLAEHDWIGDGFMRILEDKPGDAGFQDGAGIQEMRKKAKKYPADVAGWTKSWYRV